MGWTADAVGFLNSYCNTIPTPDGGTHESGLRTALVRGLKHPKLFVAAATALLDRGFGKPTQPIEGDVGFGALLAVLEARRRRSDSDAENDASK